MHLLIMALIILVFVLFGYILFLRRQMKKIEKCLVHRQRYKTNEVVSVELLDSALNQMACAVNECLKAEETLRLKVVTEEKDFRQMITNISHDLRTPLTAIKGYLQLMEQGELSVKQQERRDIIVKHTEELGDLIEHFFEYAYLLDAKPEQNPVKMNLSNVAAECMAAVVWQAEKRQMRLEIDEERVYIEADEELVTRILQNLIRNALTHGNKWMRIFFQQTDRSVKIHVTNALREGEKIDTDSLFERFYVADRSRKTTGLGLAISKILVENLGGSISAEQKSGILDITVTFLRS